MKKIKILLPAVCASTIVSSIGLSLASCSCKKTSSSHIETPTEAQKSITTNPGQKTATLNFTFKDETSKTDIKDVRLSDVTEANGNDVLSVKDWNIGSDKKTLTITIECDLTSYDTNKTFSFTTVIENNSWTENVTGCKFTFKAKHEEKILNEIELSGSYQTEYEVGQKLDLTGLVVTAKYKDGSSAVVTNYTTNPSKDTSLTKEHTKVVVSYTEETVTKTAEFGITVKDATITQISSVTYKGKMTSDVAILKYDTLEVKALYSSGATITLDKDKYTTKCDGVDVTSSVRTTGFALTAATHTILITSTEDTTKTKSISVTISQYVAVTSITLSETTATLTAGDTKQLTATVNPSNATYKTVTWESSDTSVATVSTTGLVTSKKDGSATIKVTSADTSYTTKPGCAITVNHRIDSITVNGDPTVKRDTASATYSATITGSSGAESTSVTWSSSNESAATINQSGVLTPVAVGTTTITATSTIDSTKKGQLTVTIDEPNLTDFSFSPSSITLMPGNTQQIDLTAIPSDAVIKTKTFTSNNTDIVTVNEDGLATAVANGTTTITITAKDKHGNEKTRKIDVTVQSTVPSVESLNIDPTSATLDVGGTQTITSSVSPSSAVQTVTWSSNDETVATVDDTGKVTAVGPGEAKITCKTDGTTEQGAQLTKDATITVKGVADISLNESTLTIPTTGTGTLTATTAEYVTTTSITWKSSDANVATVTESSSSGAAVTITPAAGVEEGKTCTITATAGGKSASCNVTISNKSIVINSLGFTDYGVHNIEVSDSAMSVPTDGITATGWSTAPTVSQCTWTIEPVDTWTTDPNQIGTWSANKLTFTYEAQTKSTHAKIYATYEGVTSAPFEVEMASFDKLTITDNTTYCSVEEKSEIKGQSGGSDGLRIPSQYYINSTTGWLPVTQINDGAFEASAGQSARGLPSIYIPNSITKIGTALFSNNNNTSSITIDETNPYFAVEGNCIFTIKGQTGLYLDKSLIAAAPNNMTIPTDPAKLTSINTGAFKGQVFADTIKSSLEIPANISYIYGSAFEGSNVTSVTIKNLTSTGDLKANTFKDCINLNYVVLSGSGVEKIETTNGEGPFNGCTNLMKVTLPNTITSIGGVAFVGCTHLADSTSNGVLFEGSEGDLQFQMGANNASYTWIPLMGDTTSTNPQYNAKFLTDSTYGAYNLSNAKWFSFDADDNYAISQIDSTVTFGTSHTLTIPTACITVELVSSEPTPTPHNITKIKSEGFKDNTNITTIDLNNCSALTDIGANAFSGCTGVTTIDVSSYTAVPTTWTVVSTALSGLTTGGTVKIYEDSLADGWKVLLESLGLPTTGWTYSV